MSLRESGFEEWEELELDVFNGIQSIMVEKIRFQYGYAETTPPREEEEKFIYRIAENLKEIGRAGQRLNKTKHPLNTKTVSEMIESIAYQKAAVGIDEFLVEVYNEWLEGTPEEKKAIIDRVDLSELVKETYSLVTKNLKKKGVLRKKKKGFGNL